MVLNYLMYWPFKELDLTNPASFRDLSKPMGAQTPDRLKQFQKRYNDWDDPQGGIYIALWGYFESNVFLFCTK